MANFDFHWDATDALDGPSGTTIYPSPGANAPGTTPWSGPWPGQGIDTWDWTWTGPATLIHGAFGVFVYGSPGQSNQLGDIASTSGFGAFVSGWVPTEAGVDTFHFYVADGGATGYADWYTGTFHGHVPGGLGGVANGGGGTGGQGGASSAVIKTTTGSAQTMIEAAGGGGDGGFQDFTTKAPFVAGNGGAAGNGTGVEGTAGLAGGSLTPTPVPSVNGGGQQATASGPGAGGVPNPAGGTNPGDAGAPLGFGIDGGGGGGIGEADIAAEGGGGGGGGGGNPNGLGGPWGGGGGAGGSFEGGGGGGGAGLSVLDPTVYNVAFGGYSNLWGSVRIIGATADAPLAPTLNAPPNGGYADLVDNPIFIFTYNPDTDSGLLNTWYFHQSVDGYWDAVNSVWSATIVWNDVSLLTGGTANQFTYQFPSGAFSNGVSYDWTIATTESFYNLGEGTATNLGFLSDLVDTISAGGPFTVHGEDPPTVTITSPTTGSVVSTVTPTITWSDSIPSGATPQADWFVKIFNQAQYSAAGFNPATSPTYTEAESAGTATSWTTNPLFPDNYRAYIIIADTHGVDSLWGAADSWVQFSVRLDTVYTPPTFTAVAGFDPDNGAPVAVLTVTPTDSPDAASVTYSDDGGTTWFPVLSAWMVPTSDPRFSGGAFTLYDYQIPIANPLGPPRDYRAEVNGTTSVGGVTYPAVSTWVEVDSVQVPTSGWWLSDPTSGGGGPAATLPNSVPPVPSTGTGAGSLGLHRIAGLAGGGNTAPSGGVQSAEVSIEIDQEEQQTTFYAFGRSTPITVRGDMYDEIISSGVSMIFMGQQEYDTFNQIRGRRVTVVLRSDMGNVYYGVLGGQRQVDLIRATDRTTFPMRQLGIIFTPSSPPTAPGFY